MAMMAITTSNSISVNAPTARNMRRVFFINRLAGKLGQKPRGRQGFFDGFSENEQDTFRITASASINFLIDIEPRLSNGINKDDILVLELVSDKAGQTGDVRDVLIIRSIQKWEIGISAKNNHRAVKHSRLSQKINFGEKWLGVSCSQDYFQEIKPIFDMLSDLRAEDKSTKWTSIVNMHEVVYIPILNAFRKELLRLDKENPNVVETSFYIDLDKLFSS